MLGDKPIEPNTQADYLWRLRGHLLPFFALRRLDEIDPELCLRLQEHQGPRGRRTADRDHRRSRPRDHRGRQIVPLGPSSIRKLIDTLASHPRRRHRGRSHRPQPCARQAHARHACPSLSGPSSNWTSCPRSSTLRRRRTAPRWHPILPFRWRNGAKVAELLSRGMAQSAIAAELGLAKATVNYHARRLGVEAPRHYVGRAFVVRVLGYSGVRNSELCDLRIRHVRLHDPDGARFHVPDSKTETGIRVVEMSPDLAEAFVDHLDRLRRAGSRTEPDDYVVQNTRGGRISRQRVAEIVREAATLATEGAQPARPPAAARGRRRTVCGGPTSPSLCWPIASTSSGS